MGVVNTLDPQRLFGFLLQLAGLLVLRIVDEPAVYDRLSFGVLSFTELFACLLVGFFPYLLLLLGARGKCFIHLRLLRLSFPLPLKLHYPLVVRSQLEQPVYASFRLDAVFGFQ